MHYALQLCIVIEGSMDVAFGGFERTYNTGQAFWTMFWEPHAFRFTSRRNFAMAINIDLDFLGQCGPFGNCNWLQPFVVPPAERFCPENEKERQLFKNAGIIMYRTWRNKQLNWQYHIWLKLHQLILAAIDGLCSKGDTHEAIAEEAFEEFLKIKAAVDMVRKGTGRPPSLNEAASLCSLSQSRFSNIFSRVLGMSYGKFAARSRLASAAMDLSYNRLTIDEIASKWGYFDNSHFTNAFKKLYGYSPSQYRSK
ncbi:MAG: helix-turn-helix transcriptional regulator [Victivallales bacterium]|nr:helix-turn-helix transcriptional regulator [Victivallales bacterium]